MKSNNNPPSPFRLPFWAMHFTNVRLENVTINGRPAPAIPPLTPDTEPRLKISR